MVFTMANVGLPGTSGFVGEFLTLMGAFRPNPWVGVLRHHRRDPVGRLRALALRPRHLRPAREAEPRRASWTSTAARWSMLAPLVAPDVIYYGVQPAPILDAFAPPTEALLQERRRAALATDARPPPPPGRCTEVDPMNADLQPSCPHFGPALPEIILAIGALVLVLVGAFRGERSTRARQRRRPRRCSWSRCSRCCRSRRHRASRPSAAPSSPTTSPRYMKALVLLGSAATLALSSRLHAARALRPLRVSRSSSCSRRSA